ncbi:diacylglycerol kinase family enzyme [Paucimonas lemoignei]|uniref:Diacylglycerol kinase family enzyme n=1 Tax=Paucimonas lemoignei TaxID=29443 RepID=A0A4R3I0T2_PAULE|nr:diacylglycerol kinase family protein [Paucimonas lemoignei]TCS39317.1 diacylglycerol kinase family enzyme [Paucimonas lemoignei]
MATSSDRNEVQASGFHPGETIASAGEEHRPLFIVMNAGSGRRNADAARDAIDRQLREAGHPGEILLCRKSRDLSSLIRRAVELAGSHNGVIVAAGGDGTIRTVAQQVISTGLPFGVIPKGTFNYFARDNGLPQDPYTAAKALIAGVRAGTERLVKVGQLNDQIFLVNASMGLYPQLLEDRETYKQRYGRSRLVALWAGLLTLIRRNAEMLLRFEYASGRQEHGAEVVRASTLFVGNNALQLDQVGLSEDNGERTAELTVLVLPAMNAIERLSIALRGMMGRLNQAPDTSHFQCRQLSVEPLARAQRRKVKIAMDGESAWMRPPLVFRVAPRPLRLVVPPTGWSDA